MIYIIFIILFAFLILDFSKDKKLISPIKLFNLIWIVILGLYYFKLSYLQQDFSFRTLLIFFLCIVFYDIVSFYMLYVKRSYQKERKKLYIPKIDIEKKLKYVNYIFIILFVVECIYSKGFPVLFKLTTGYSNYLNFGIPSLHGVLNGLAIVLATYYILKKSKWKYLYILFAVLTISRQVIISIIIQTIIVSILFAIKENKKINYKKYIFGGIIVLFAFAMFGNFRSGSDMMGIIFRSKYPNLPNPIMWVYSYTEFSLSNFNNLVSMTNGMVNYGASSLLMFLPTVVLKFLNISPVWQEKYIIQDSFNVSTWFPEIYLDFGILGIIIFSILIAVLGSYLYKKTQKNLNIENGMIYAVFAHNILLFFFVNMFLYIPIVAEFIYIPLLFREKEEKKTKNTKWLNDKNAEKVAILMATYNGEKYLKDQIDSILNQSYKNFTIFIRDDSSNDNTRKIIQDYYQKYPEKIVIVKDKKKSNGASDNFLLLLEYVSKLKEYNLFMFSDQDDIWLENKIEITIEKYESINDKNKPILIHTDLLVVDSKLNKINDSFIKYSNLKVNHIKFNKYLIQNNVTGCTMLINKNLVDLVDFNIKKEIIMHDWYFALLASAFGIIEFINESTIKYRQHGNNVLGAKKIKGIKDIYNKLISNNNMKNDLIKIINQGQSFKKKYYDLLNDKNKKVIDDFCKLKYSSKFVKIKIIIKNKFYKQGIDRIVGEFIYI